MKIAIYHNLEKGGALIHLEEIVKVLIKKRHKIDLFSLNDNANIPGISRKQIYNITYSKNIFKHIYQALYVIPKINRKIAGAILHNKYKCVLVFPCRIIQTPHLLAELKNHPKTIYFFEEPKREFYEKVSFDHFSFRRIIARIIRYPIKIIDKNNCTNAKYIISNSVYSNYLLKKIYKKNGILIYPAMEKMELIKMVKKNNKKFSSVGLITFLKGYMFSLLQLKGIRTCYSIIGKPSFDTAKIIELSKRTDGKIRFISNKNNQIKSKILESSTFYLANQFNEPFGLSTLEATTLGCYVFGINKGGTSEIIEHGINGILYKKNIKIAKKVLNNFYNKKTLKFYLTCKIDWECTVNKIMNIL